jgi:hypothetical protein
MKLSKANLAFDLWTTRVSCQILVDWLIMDSKKRPKQTIRTANYPSPEMCVHWLDLHGNAASRLREHEQERVRMASQRRWSLECSW